MERQIEVSRRFFSLAVPGESFGREIPHMCPFNFVPDKPIFNLKGIY
jgi:hypothetical protein